MADEDTKEAPPTNDEPAAEADTGGTAEPGREKEFTFVEDPTFEVDYKGDCAYEVKVTVPPANETKQAEEMYEELRQEAEVPGFRRGRAPRKLIEKKFSKVVRSEVEGKLVNAAFRKLVKDEDLRPIAQPDIEGLEDAEARNVEEPLTFTLRFEVAPRIELGKYREVEVERPVLKIEEKDIDEAIDDMRSRFAVYESLDGGVAAKGDQVIIDFEGRIEGEPFQGGSAQNYPYILGTQRVFPEFEQVLQGASPGDDVSCEVTFPDDYFNESLRGQRAEFQIKVNDVKRQTLPEINDAFAKQAGYDDVASMREGIAERLRGNAASRSDEIAEQRALNAVIEDSSFDIPKSLVASVTGDIYGEETERLRRLRLPASAIEEREEEIRERAREQALHEIKSITVLNEIADAEGIEVTEEDMEREAEAISQRTGAALDMVSQYMAEDEKRSSFEARILRNKAMRVVMANAKVVDKEIPREELEKGDGAEEEEE